VAQLFSLGIIRTIIYEHYQRPNTAACTRAAGDAGFHRSSGRQDAAATFEASGTVFRDGVVSFASSSVGYAFHTGSSFRHEPEVFCFIRDFVYHVSRHDSLAFDFVSRSPYQ
jgi:hypothetical protein